MRGAKRTKLIRIKSPELMGNAAHPMVQYLLAQDDDGNKLTAAPEPQVPEDILQAFKMFNCDYCHVEYRGDGTHKILGSVPRIATLAKGKVYTIDGQVTPHKVVTYKTSASYIDSAAPELRLINLNASHAGAPNTYTPCNVTHTAYLRDGAQYCDYAGTTDTMNPHIIQGISAGIGRHATVAASAHIAGIPTHITPDSLTRSVDSSFIDASRYAVESRVQPPPTAIAINPHASDVTARVLVDNTNNSNKE